MGNTCTTGAMGRQRICLMERHTLSEEQMSTLEEMFKKAANGKRYVSFGDFQGFYPESKFQRDEADMRSVYYAFADPKTKNLKYDGFVTLMLLSNRVGSVSEDERMQALFSLMDPVGSKSILRTDFSRFVSNFESEERAKEEDGVEPRLTGIQHADLIDGASANDNTSSAIEFKEFSLFCSRRKGIYRAICSYVFPMQQQ